MRRLLVALLLFFGAGCGMDSPECILTRPLSAEVVCHIKISCENRTVEMFCACGDNCICFLGGEARGVLLTTLPGPCALDDEEISQVLRKGLK